VRRSGFGGLWRLDGGALQRLAGRAGDTVQLADRHTVHRFHLPFDGRLIARHAGGKIGQLRGDQRAEHRDDRHRNEHGSKHRGDMAELQPRQ
jgi:hypothetical protein